MFEALFKGVSTLFGLRTIEKSVENLDFIFCSAFQNFRLGSVNFANILTTIRGSEFKGIREKAGLCPKWGLVADGRSRCTAPSKVDIIESMFKHVSHATCSIQHATFQGGLVVDTFVEMFEMEIVEKRGLVADGCLGRVKPFRVWLRAHCGEQKSRTFSPRSKVVSKT
jgi:hypothetical protein